MSDPRHQLNGGQRLSALAHAGLLDTPAEPSFDRLTRLAARLLKAPVALLSLVDSDRQFFKSCVGLPEPWSTARQTPLSHSFCQHVVTSGRPLVIEDARQDPLVRDNKAIADLGVLAYLGVPLATANGMVLGSCCAIDFVPRLWTDDEVQTLTDVAVSVMTEVTLRQTCAVRLRSEELVAAQRELLKEADRRKDEFLAMLAHELRNPLAAIQSALHLARQPAVSAADLAWTHEIIDRQSRHSVRLIDDLLDISRITQGKIQLRVESIDFSDVVARAVAVVRPLLEKKRHELTLSLGPGPLPLVADPTRIEQILVNLLNNAAKYSDGGGHIRLEAQRQGDTLVVRVSDTGVGIAPAMLPCVFELFTQVTGSLDRSQGGLGIGLTLVKTLTEMHGGSIEAASEGPGKGSEFTLRLPAATNRPPAAGNASASPGPANRCARILVVDDNVDGAKSIAKLLELSRYNVTVAHDGDAALEAALEHRPEVVLLDIGLPGRDGYEVARALRQQEHGKSAFIIALTGYAQEEDRSRTLAAGFDGHLIKPVDFDGLLKLLATIDVRDSPH